MAHTIRKILLRALIAGALLGGATTSGHAAAQTSESPVIRTARGAVIFALQNSPDTAIAQQRIVAADSARQEAAAAFLPTLNLGASYLQTSDPMNSFGTILNQGSFSNDIDFNNPGRTDNLNMKAELGYRLYNGGRDLARRAAADARYLAEQHNRQEIEQRLGFEVVRAFQDIVGAHEQVTARRAQRDAVEASLHVARARFEAGDMLKTDVLNLEVQLARAGEDLIVSYHRLDLAEKILLNLLGLTHGSVVIDGEAVEEQPVPGKESYRVRPETAGLTARLKAAQAEIETAQAARFPTLDTFADYHYDQGYVVEGSGDAWTAGIRLNQNLFSGNKISAGIAAKQADYKALKERLRKLQLAVNLDIEKCELNYRQAVERREVTEKMVHAARESAHLSREQFKEGTILSSDLIEAEVRLTEALLRKSMAETNYRTAIADLRRAAGYQQFEMTTAELMEHR